ncbi:MAG: TetR/AcrR family transcriptional regulator [Dissulfuribacterales bacterium]
MKSNAKMEEIITAAVSLFGSKGYLRTSMTEIAEAVELTKGGLYHYFNKKVDILVMIHDRMLNAFEKSFRESSRPTEDPGARLSKWIRAHAILIKEYQPHVKIFFTELDHLKNIKHYKEIVSQRDEIFNILFNIIKEGRKQKCFRDDIHPKVLTFLVMGMVNWFYQWYRPDGPRSIEKIIKDVQYLVLDGVVKRQK